MLNYIKDGFKVVCKQPVLLLLLFIYQFIWGFVLYRFIKSIAVPLLHRYPGEELTSSAANLFVAESQFRLLKTDIAASYIWILAVIIVLKMLLTSIMNAGIIYSFHHTELNPGYRFFKGIRELSKPYLLYYVLQMLVTAAPLLWVIPRLADLAGHMDSLQKFGLEAAGYLFGMLIYGYLTHQAFLFILLGKLTQVSWWSALGTYFRKLLPIMIVSLSILTLSGIITLLAASAQMYWAGLIAVIIYQAFHFIKIVFKAWAVASQYEIWVKNTRG